MAVPIYGAGLELDANKDQKKYSNKLDIQTHYIKYS